MNRRLARLLSVWGLNLLFLPLGFLWAETTSECVAFEKTLRFGMSTAITGPAGALGRDVRDGVNAAFKEANDAGGVNGWKLELVAFDDGYEPARTAPNMRRLTNKERVVAVIGNVGTPTAIAAVPIANSTQTLLFGAYTGAGVLRKSPPDRYVINYRASYAEETAAMVTALMDNAGISPEEVAFFTQRDGYGDAGFVGGLKALRKAGLPENAVIAHGRYERNTTNVEKALAEILFHPTPPKAVIMVGAYGPCGKFIRLATKNGFSPLFLNVSFVGARQLAAQLGSVDDRVIVTQVVPHPHSDLEIAKKYRAALCLESPEAEPSHVSFEGYIAASVLIHAMEAIEGEPNRESIVDALESLGEFQLGSDLRLELTPHKHQASEAIWPTELIGGRVVPFNWQRLSVRSKVKQ